MGLEFVELIMRVEEEFSIDIQDSEAEHCITPGGLCDLIEHKLSLYQPSPTVTMRCPTSRAFYAVRRELMKLGVERKQITPQTSLAALLPRSHRRHTWKALGQGLDYSLPYLHRPPCWTVIGLLPLGIFPFWLNIFSSTGALYCVACMLFWWLGARFTEPLAVHPPNYLASVADLCRSLAPLYTAADAPLNVWPQVQAIIADEMGLPIEQVRRDFHYVRDLGMG